MHHGLPAERMHEAIAVMCYFNGSEQLNMFIRSCVLRILYVQDCVNVEGLKCHRDAILKALIS